MRLQIDSRSKALSEYIAKCESAGVPEELQSYLFKFGTVLICGFVERSLETIILGRLSNRAQGRVLEFVKSHFQRGTNYDCNAIGQLLGRFDTDWRKLFMRFVEDNPDIREGISSCYAVRNSVAHGGSAGIGVKRLRELLQISQRLVEALIQATSSRGDGTEGA